MTTPARVFTAGDFTDRFEALCADLEQATVDTLLAAYNLWQSGTITADSFRELIVTAVATNNAAARQGADVLATYFTMTAAGEVLAPVGPAVTPEADMARLSKAAATIVRVLDTADDIAMQLDRLGRNEPAAAAQGQALHTYAGHDVKGYRRHLNAGACELCEWLVKAHLDPEGIGYIYPTNKPMHRHTGCRCTPVPATKKAKL